MRKNYIYLLVILCLLTLITGCKNKPNNHQISENDISPSAPSALGPENETIIEPSFCFNSDFITSEPLTVEAGTQISSDIKDWIISENYNNIEVSIDIADSENNLTKLPGFYFPISSPYKITFKDVTTEETLYIEVHVTGGEDRNPETYDWTSDPYYNATIEKGMELDPELYNENEDYFYCTNLNVLSEQENFLPSLAIADFANRVYDFIEPLAIAGNWEQPESCYILTSTMESTDEYSRFHIYINPLQNLEIQVTYYYESGYDFVIIKS